MSFKGKGWGVWWMAALLSVASLAAAAAPSDLRLVEAARKGDKEAVRSLLRQHVNVNTAQADGATALSWVVYRDDIETADLLIGVGASVKAANIYGVVPLMLACNNGSAPMVNRLLKAGAEASPAILMKCSLTGDAEAVKSLLARGADANAKETRENQTALMWAVSGKHLEAARALIERGADVNARSEGFTPLMFAAQQDDMETAKLLLDKGAQINDANEEGDTPLLVASASGHEELSIFLLDKGADANASEKNGFTALHYSVMQGLSILTGIRVQRAKERQLAPHLMRPNMVELVKALLAHGANPNARIKKGAIGDKLQRISGVNPPIGAIDPTGATAYLMAAAVYDANVMRILVAGGANPKLTTVDHVTALMLASGRLRIKIFNETEEEEARALEAAKLAVEMGDNVNETDSKLGLTAIYDAAINGSSSIVQFLAAKGANLDAKDKYGQTPLAKASNIKPPGNVDPYVVTTRAQKTTAELLLKLGAAPVAETVAQGSDKEPAAATAGE